MQSLDIQESQEFALVAIMAVGAFLRTYDIILSSNKMEV